MPARARTLPAHVRESGGERGSSTIGYLLVFPMVLFMSFGLFQFILYALAVEEISTAAREGARRAALDGSTFDEGARLAGEIVTDGSVLAGDITVTGERGPVETTMTVSGQCKWLLSEDLFGDVCRITRTETVPTDRFVEGIVAS
ncbi:MAG: TadE/TadG family type IV pilus assembly protein [Acidimicrobiales bacterium]